MYGSHHRSYPNADCIDDHDGWSTWNDYSYIVEKCQVTLNVTNAQRSAKLVCDMTDGLSLELYEGFYCNETLVSTTNYLEGDDFCSNETEGPYRRLIECVDRSNDTQPGWITRSPTMEPTKGPQPNNNDEDTWMIVGIVFICLLVIVVVVGLVVYCQSKDKHHYSQSSTSEMGGYHE